MAKQGTILVVDDNKAVLIVVLAAGLVVGLFGMLRRQTEDRKGAESYAEAAAIAGAELPAAEPAAQTPAEEQETQDPYLRSERSGRSPVSMPGSA